MNNKWLKFLYICKHFTIITGLKIKPLKFRHVFSIFFQRVDALSYSSRSQGCIWFSLVALLICVSSNIASSEMTLELSFYTYWKKIYGNYRCLRRHTHIWVTWNNKMNSTAYQHKDIILYYPKISLKHRYVHKLATSLFSIFIAYDVKDTFLLHLFILALPDFFFLATSHLCSFASSITLQFTSALYLYSLT